MIWLVARREVTDHLRSVRFIALCALTVVLLPLSAYADAEGWRSRRAFADALVQARDAKLAAARADRSARTQAQSAGIGWGWRGGEVATDEVLRAVREPSPLSVLALGADATLPAYWQFGSEGVSAGPPLAGGEDAAAFAGADFVFVVQVVLGLLAVLLGADAVSGEAESGMLRVVLANPVPRAHVIAGKYVGRLLTLLVPIALGAPLALLVLRVRGVPLGADGGWLRAVLFAGAALLYLSTMLALSLAVSARTQRARTALVVLLVAWVLVVLVVPRIAEVLATALRPVAPAELVRRNRAAVASSLEAERADALIGVWRRVAGGDDVPDGQFPPDLKRAYNDARRPVEEEMFRRKRAAFAAIEDARDREARRQRALAGLVARLSPAASFATIAADLAGTGERTRERWQAQVRAHQHDLESAAFDRVFGVELFAARYGRLRMTWGPDPSDPADAPPDYDDLPRFAYVAERPGEAVAAAMPGMLYLAACNGALLAAAVAGFVRYEVR